MNYYFIYSAGGGAGDWNGLKRVWLNEMPVSLKQKVLLKFGDVFFNHASLSSLIRPKRWQNITNMRSWLSTNVKDNYITSNTSILLDSGTSKIVSLIKTMNPTFDATQLIHAFDNLINRNNILQKYVSIIQNSNIENAVTFDIPNPFKIRTQSANTITNIFNNSTNNLMITTSANYSNRIFSLLSNSQNNLSTIINGLWSVAEINNFLSQLSYSPDKIAIGGLTRANATTFVTALDTINSVLPFNQLQSVHLLGCGGIANVNYAKLAGYNANNISVDNSTPFNRAIDGNKAGTKKSGYFDYTSNGLFRINAANRNNILQLHSNAIQPYFNLTQMTSIIDSIIMHQSGNSNHTTFDNRARLIIHNHDVFRKNAM